MNAKDATNRSPLQGDHFERTFKVLDFSKDTGGRAGEVCALLNDCYPAGNQRDTRGATSNQMAFILTLTDLNEEEFDDFFRIITCSGGISSQQAHHLINKLKDRPI